MERRLENGVLQNDDGLLTFAAWWKTVDDDEKVEVQFTYECHGLSGRVSNHHKKGVMAGFLQFVDSNSQPNVRQQGSYSTQFFFQPKFTRLTPPRAVEKNYDEKASSSLVHEFNKMQNERGKRGCGPTATSESL